MYACSIIKERSLCDSLLPIYFKLKYLCVAPKYTYKSDRLKLNYWVLLNRFSDSLIINNFL